MTSTIHHLVDGRGLPLVVLVGPGQAHDNPMLPALLTHLRVERDGSRSWFKTALAEAGLEPMTLHGLRHTAASMSISAGANVKAVQLMLGHASAAMTLDIYADLFDDDLNAVSDRLDDAYERSVMGKVWANDGSTLPQTGR